jgi:undecaprenyl diphosphate synthase
MRSHGRKTPIPKPPGTGTTRIANPRGSDGETQPRETASRRAVVPRHIAIVMDGNGRWARRRGQPRTFGHRAGQKAVRATVAYCMRNGVEVLTLFAFSSENWKRPDSEVGALMDLFLKALDKEIDELHKNQVRVRFVGELSAFSGELRDRMQAASLRTASNARLVMNVCVSYGGRWDIVQAARRAAEAVAEGRLDPVMIDERTLATYFCLADVPPPDLFIRTGGEHRISNFLLWQLAYTELYFTDTLWPDMDDAEFDRALDDFARRDRRFGCAPAPAARAS